MLFQACLNNFYGHFMDMSSMFQAYFEEVGRIFQGCFKRIRKKDSKVFQRSLKVVSGKFQQCAKSVSNFFKGVSRKFCFLILHGTHCSYPSRRRACTTRRDKGVRGLITNNPLINQG